MIILLYLKKKEVVTMEGFVLWQVQAHGQVFPQNLSVFTKPDSIETTE